MLGSGVTLILRKKKEKKKEKVNVALFHHQCGVTLLYIIVTETVC